MKKLTLTALIALGVGLPSLAAAMDKTPTGSNAGVTISTKEVTSPRLAKILATLADESRGDKS
jgi:hypothetical protein